MAEDNTLKFTIGTTITLSSYFDEGTAPDLQSILLKAVKDKSGATASVYPITRADKVRGLQSILDDIASKITAAQSAATTTIVSAKDGAEENADNVLTIASVADGTDGSLTYTIGLPTFAIGTAPQSTRALYKITVDKYGRVTGAQAAESTDILGLNAGTDVEASRIASEATARSIAKTLSPVVGSVQNNEDGKLTVSAQNTDNDQAASQYSVSLAEIGSGFKVVIGTDADGNDKYGEGLAKITVDKFGRVTSTAVPTQKDIIALATGSDSETLVTRTDVTWIANSMQSLLQNTNAMQYQGIITTLDPDGDDGNTKLNWKVISAALKAYNGGSTDVAAKPGDVFMLGTDIPSEKIDSNTVVIANGAINLEAGDMLVCVTPKASLGSTNTDISATQQKFYVIQKNIDGAVTTAGTFDAASIIVGANSGTKTVTSKSAAELKLLELGTAALPAHNLLIGANGNKVDESGISVEDLSSSMDVTDNFTKVLAAGTAGYVLTKTADGYEFQASHNDPKLTLTDTTINMTVKENGSSQATTVGTVVFSAGTAITLATSADTITVVHAEIGSGATVTATTGTAANGGSIVIPSVTVDTQGHVTSLSPSTVTLPQYAGTANQIVLNNNAFGLATATAAVTTGTADANIGSKFSAITGVTTDDYGRVTKVDTTEFTIPAASMGNLNVVKVSAAAENTTYSITGASSTGTDITLNADSALTFSVGTGGVTLAIGTDKNATTISGGVFSGALSKKFTVGDAEYNGSEDIIVTLGTGVEMATGNVITLSTTLDFGTDADGIVIGTAATTANVTKANGGPLTVPQLTVDNYGRVIEVGTKELELPKTYISVGDTTVFIAPTAEITDGGKTDNGINIPFGTGIEVYDNKICGALTYEFVDA